MGFNKEQFRDLITRILKEFDPDVPFTESAVELLMLTAAQESQLGTYLKQIKGPAVGIFQVEPNTHDDLVKTYLKNRPHLVQKIKDVSGVDHFDAKMLEYNIAYAICIARLVYFRKPATLPENKLNELAEYWKRWYNTYLGSGTAEEAIANYKRYC